MVMVTYAVAQVFPGMRFVQSVFQYLDLTANMQQETADETVAGEIDQAACYHAY